MSTTHTRPSAMHRRATRTAWRADRPGRNPNDDPGKPGSKTGVSTCAIACWISRSRQVGTDDSYCPSCNRVWECSGWMLICVVRPFGDTLKTACRVALTFSAASASLARAGAAGGWGQVAGLSDAGPAVGLDLAGPGDAEPVAGTAAGGELSCLEPVVKDACTAAQPAGGLGDAEFARVVGVGCRDLVGVADPLN